MEKKRVLLLGGSGQMGQALRQTTLPDDIELWAPLRRECDLENASSVRDTFQNIRPHLVINSAAMTAVDVCENEKDKAFSVNFDAVANLAAQCSAHEALFIHLSTDYVFDGNDGNKPYKPEDAMNPVNNYGGSKMMGEEAIRHELPWHVIVRVSSVFSALGSNILTKTLSMISERDALKLVNDQIACPSYAPFLARSLIKIASALLNGKVDGFGTFHLTGTPPTTRYAFTESILEIMGPLSLKKPTLLPAKTSDFPGLAARPLYSVLDCTKILNVYGIEPEPWQKGLLEAIPLWLNARGQAA